MLRISSQQFQHIWLRTAGEAVFSMHFFILVLEVCQLLVGLQGAGEESSNSWGGRFSNSRRTDFRECRIHCSEQLNSNHFILKTSQQTEDNNSLCLQDLYYRCQAGKLTYRHFALHTLCHVTLNKLFYEYWADITILKMRVHLNASQEHRNTRGLQHNGAFKNTSAFFDSFYQAQGHSLLYE